MIKITNKIFIREDGFVFNFSRSSGPGGQNVNKVNTRVTLFFDVVNCRGLSSLQKQMVLKYLASRVNKDGFLKIVSQKERSQKANRQAAIERFTELLRKALKEKKVRKKTSVPQHSHRKRLEKKKQRSILKQQRAKVILQ